MSQEFVLLVHETASLMRAEATQVSVMVAKMEMVLGESPVVHRLYETVLNLREGADRLLTGFDRDLHEEKRRAEQALFGPLKKLLDKTTPAGAEEGKG